MEKIIIAIDGHSSCGKSTLAKSLARILKYIYIDSGAMYRCVTLFAIRENLIRNGVPDREAIISNLPNILITFHFNDALEMNTTFMNGENVEDEIRLSEVSSNVSPVSTIREVRQAMVKQQQEIGKNKGIVMDGRDIGTVVFPDAELKIFMTALPEIRAQRRFLELSLKGQKVEFEGILSNISERDLIDSSRKESPLCKAGDAIVLDNSFMSIGEQLEWAKQKVGNITGITYES